VPLRAAFAWAALLLAACPGRHEGPGEVTHARVGPERVTERSQRQRGALAGLRAEPAAKSILFGDLHVHSTFSPDAFMFSLPMFQGKGAHPPADACDFARFCSDLDFFSINDHAEGLTPAHWAETKESIRECNAVAGDPADPDLVAFLGFEWSQTGRTREQHWGHRNVIFRELADDRVPRRPIGAGASEESLAHLGRRPPLHKRLAPLLRDPEGWRRHRDLLRLQAEIGATPVCPGGVDTRSLPADCRELAATPAALFEKLDQWGFDVLVIPHGTAWGLNTPLGSSYTKQLVGRQHDPAKQRLIEVYSGHGNSEEYRGWSPGLPGPNGELSCPEPTPEYLPCCWQAGEIVRARCPDPRSAECEERVAHVRRRYLASGLVGASAVPDANVADWKDCGHCRDCFEPAARYQPRNSVQYALALGNFAGSPEAPRRFRFGLVASSDNHSARAGTGYKEFARLQMTDARGARDESVRGWARLLFGREFERQASFFLTGGLVAVHSEGRDRDAIWQALLRREVYGTSGERILLWFDLLNAPGGPLPMGAELALAEAPRFRVRAVGALAQEPGCPADAVHALGPERLERLCLGECHHPGDRRRAVMRIEVVRIRPQIRRGEPIGELVEDPWRRFACAPDPAGCVVEFEDPEFVAGGREHVYYVRAVQEATPAVNAGALRCEYGADGECVRPDPCYADWRTPANDDCLAPSEERAWSSPIFLAPGADAP
jgi:hypothetical protein